VSIEVVHNPLALISRKLIKVKNARAAEVQLNLFCETKDDRGYRVRYVPDHENDTIELGGRWSYPVAMALRCLKDSGLFVRELPWKQNALLKKSHK
jgi:hypothetical protein